MYFSTKLFIRCIILEYIQPNYSLSVSIKGSKYVVSSTCLPALPQFALVALDYSHPDV